jgi:hypothetical protein
VGGLARAESIGSPLARRHLTAAGTRAARRVTLVLDEVERRVRGPVPERELEGLRAVATLLADLVEPGWRAGRCARLAHGRIAAFATLLPLRP